MATPVSAFETLGLSTGPYCIRCGVKLESVVNRAFLASASPAFGCPACGLDLGAALTVAAHEVGWHEAVPVRADDWYDDAQDVIRSMGSGHRHVHATLCGRALRSEPHDDHFFQFQADDDSPEIVVSLCPGHYA